MFQNPYLNQNHIYSELKTKFIIVWNSKQKSKTKYNVIKFIFLHQVSSSYSHMNFFNNKTTKQVIIQNLKILQYHSQFRAVNINSNCPLFNPNQPNLILPYNDNTSLSTLSYIITRFCP